MQGISSFFKSSLTNNLYSELCSFEKQWKDYQNLKARPLKMTRYKKFVKLPSTTHFAPHSGNLQVSDMITVRLENLLLKLLTLREDPFWNVLPQYGHFFRTLWQCPYGGNTFQGASFTPVIVFFTMNDQGSLLFLLGGETTLCKTPHFQWIYGKLSQS